MANTIFVADNTIPGLGASDLAWLGFAVSGDGSVASRPNPRGPRASRGPETRKLRDLGIDRESC